MPRLEGCMRGAGRDPPYVRGEERCGDDGSTRYDVM
jgi:hypothetical protein